MMCVGGQSGTAILSTISSADAGIVPIVKKLPTAAALAKAVNL